MTWYRQSLQLSASANATQRCLHEVDLAAAAGDVTITLPATGTDPCYVGVTNASAVGDGSKIILIQTAAAVEVARVTAAGQTVWVGRNPATGAWEVLADAMPTSAPLATWTGASNTVGKTQRGRTQPVDPGGTTESFAQVLLPLNATTPLDIGFSGELVQTTDGILAINGATSGVSVLSARSLQTMGKNAVVRYEKIGTDTWYLSGDLMPPTRGSAQWNDSYQLPTAPGFGLRGSTTGFWGGLLGVINAQTLNITRHLVSCMEGAITGYFLSALTTNATVVFNAAFTGPVFVQTPVYNVVAGDVGKLIAFLWKYDPAANRLRIWAKGAEVGNPGTTTAGLNYLPAAATMRMYLGRRSSIGANAPPDWTLCGLCGGDAFVPTDQEILDWFAKVKATGDVQPIAGKTTRLYSHRRQNVRANLVMWNDWANLTSPNSLGTATSTWAPNGPTNGQAPADLTFVELVNPSYAW